jgi:hypothetical protein
MIALFILTFGLLATAQLLSVAASAGSLARSSETATIAAQDQLEQLADRFRRTPDDPDLAPGLHGPRTIEVTDTTAGTVLNRFDIAWEVSEPAPVRPGVNPGAREVTVTVTPVVSTGAPNRHPRLNKVVGIASIFSTRFP